MKLRIVCGVLGQGQHDLVLPDNCCLAASANDGATSNEQGNSGAAGDVDQPWTVLRLKQEIESVTQMPCSSQRLVHAGKTIVGDDVLLSDLKLKDGDKMIVLGKRPQIELDEGYARLMHVDTKSVAPLVDRLKQLSEDVGGLESGHLPREHLADALRTVEKRLKTFNEDGMRVLETLDGLSISGPNTSEQQLNTNRDKRKSLVKTVQELLHNHDSLEERRRAIATAVVPVVQVHNGSAV